MPEKDKRPPSVPSGLRVRIGKAYVAPRSSPADGTRREPAEVGERAAPHREPVRGSFSRIKLPRDPVALGKLIRDIARGQAKP